MRIFAQRTKPTQKTESAKSTVLIGRPLGKAVGLNSIPDFQRTTGNQAVQRHMYRDVKGFKMAPVNALSPGFAHDFSRVPVLSGRTTLEGGVNEESGPLSLSLSSGVTTSTPAPPRVRPPSPSPPAPAPPRVSPPAPSPPACTIATRTMVSAPDGTADTRKTVGVNEQVEMTSSVSARWTTRGGTVVPTSGTTVVWTAPGAGATCQVTATPLAGRPCLVAMRVIPPSSRSLVKQSNLVYDPGKAGSGFLAKVTIMPTRVSFMRTELREETASSVATGYYKTVLHWDGIPHRPTSWLTPNANNSGLEDTIGTSPPGTTGPFSVGTFLWRIPQSYRTAGTTGGGTVYSRANHNQRMGGTNGAETTSKEGASRRRVP